MKKVILAKGAVVAVALLPALALAADAISVLSMVRRVLDIVIPIVVTLALIYFLWGLAQFILSAGDEEKKKDGKHIMIWGIIALFVMVSVWGLVSVIGSSFGIDEGGQGVTPSIYGPGTIRR